MPPWRNPSTCILLRKDALCLVGSIAQLALLRSPTSPGQLWLVGAALKKCANPRSEHPVRPPPSNRSNVHSYPKRSRPLPEELENSRHVANPWPSPVAFPLVDRPPLHADHLCHFSLQQAPIQSAYPDPVPKRFRLYRIPPSPLGISTHHHFVNSALFAHFGGHRGSLRSHPLPPRRHRPRRRHCQNQTTVPKPRPRRDLHQDRPLRASGSERSVIGQR